MNAEENVKSGAPGEGRYASIVKCLGPELTNRIQNARVLVVGAGGIGCELLKNLSLTGFRDLETIDLDTIDVSNLNRQFLFRKRHVGKSKAEVASGAATEFNKDCQVKTHFGNVKSDEFNLKYFKSFDLVLNALDNVNARQHVNRLCLGAQVPMIDAGTTGYLGQVTVVQKDETQCYDCEPKSENNKVYPICTIRNTPDKPVHCIVWAKELHKLLFGKMADSMLASALESEQATTPGSVAAEAASTEEADTDADKESKDEAVLSEMRVRSLIMHACKRPESETERLDVDGLKKYAMRVFDAVYDTEIKVKLEMRDGYKGAKIKPTPISFVQATQGNMDGMDVDDAAQQAPTVGLKDQVVWSAKKSAEVLVDCVVRFWLERHLDIGDSCVFDKDQPIDLDFVTAASNLRSHVFGIERKSKFDVKGIAGNIVHAIATTNAIVAGLQVLEAIKILKRRAPMRLLTTEEKEKTETDNKPLTETNKFVWVVRSAVGSGFLVQPTALEAPNSKCYTCGNAMLVLSVDTTKATLGMLVEKVLKVKLGMNAPTVTVGESEMYAEGQGLDPDEIELFQANTLRILDKCPSGGIKDSTIVEAEDFTQDLTLKLLIVHRDNEAFEKEGNADLFSISGEVPVASAVAATPTDAAAAQDDDDDDDDIVVMEAPGGSSVASVVDGEHQNKKARVVDESGAADNDVIELC